MTKSEAQTRSELIDQQLALAGWNVKDPTQVVEEFDILTELPDGVAGPSSLGSSSLRESARHAGFLSSELRVTCR